MSIEEFIKCVKKRPLMYIEEIKMEYLYYLIIGFLGSNLINHIVDNVDQHFKSYFFQWVKKWVLKNIDKNYEEKSFYWYHIIKEITNSEEEAVNLFFLLCEEFFSEYHMENNHYS